MPTKLSELLELNPLAESRGPDSMVYRGAVDPVFTIGPKVHGGSLQIMIAVAARRALTELAAGDTDPALFDGITPLAIASDYLAAPDPADVDIAARIVKRGRTVSLVHVDVSQGGRSMVSSTVTLGRLDHGDPHFRGATLLDDLPPAPADDAIAIDTSPLGEVVHLAPALDLALEAASFPLARGETGEPTIRGWTRPKEIAEQPAEMELDFPVLVCDISPPVVMNLGLVGWAPTVQLTTYLRRRPAPGWLRFAASSSEVGQGMFAEDHIVVDETGVLIAQSRQLALIPAGR